MAISSLLEVKFDCGDTETEDFSKTPAGERKSKSFRLGKHFICSRCFKQQTQTDLLQHNEGGLTKAMTLAQDHDLPELTGSEKQVAWTTRISFTVLAGILQSEENQNANANTQENIETTKGLTKAGWCIDNFQDISDSRIDDLIKLILTGIDASEDDRIETENPF